MTNEDAVVRATFPVDIHALSAGDNKKAAYGNAGVKMKPYDIPLRALTARDVDGLVMEGRCISGASAVYDTEQEILVPHWG